MAPIEAPEAPQAEAMPPAVAEVMQNEFGNKPEEERAVWNTRFNDLADQLKLRLSEPRPMITSEATDQDNLAIGLAKTAVRIPEGQAKLLEKGVLETSLYLAELAAKVTGGRKIASPKTVA